MTPIDDIDHTKLMNIFIDNTPIPLDRFDNDYLLMNIEIIEYGWVSDPAFHYYPNLHFFTTVHRHLDDGSIVDSLSWLWYISNFTLNGNELTIYYNNQGTKGGYSYRENQIWKYNLDYGVTTEFSDNYTITSPVEATGAVFSYKFELMTELTEPIINTNISSSNTISDSDPTTSSITSSTTTSVTEISTSSSMSNSESISISDSQSTSQEPGSGTSTSSASPLIMSETLIVMGIIIVNQKYKSRTK